ncbi:MAG TPA: hypothetical protein VLJ11_22040 [Bryobacteraceae bacterium]|nr:hypothetical protein [Bryobacteraceae bacterium]
MAVEENGPTRSATENIRELTDASKKLFAAGEQLTNNLNELEQRVEHALDWRSRLGDHALLLAGVGLAVSVLLWRAIKS